MFFGNAEQLRQSEIGRLFPDEEIVEDPRMLGFISQPRTSAALGHPPEVSA